jgi:hypothetical protein
MISTDFPLLTLGIFPKPETIEWQSATADGLKLPVAD